MTYDTRVVHFSTINVAFSMKDNVKRLLVES